MLWQIMQFFKIFKPIIHHSFIINFNQINLEEYQLKFFYSIYHKFLKLHPLNY